LGRASFAKSRVRPFGAAVSDAASSAAVGLNSVGRDDLICIVQKTPTIIKDYTALGQKHFLHQKKDKYRNTTKQTLRFCFTRSVRDRVATEDAQYQMMAPNTTDGALYQRAPLLRGGKPEIKMRRDQ